MNILQQTFVLLFLTLSVTCFQIQTEPETEISTPQISAIPWPFTVCGNGDWTITSLTLDQTPKRNTNDNIVTVLILFIQSGTANAAITFKKVDLTVKLNGAPLDQQTHQFTNSYDAGDAIEYSFENYIPGFAPIGTYTLNFQFIDSKDKNNGCMSFQFKL